MDFDGWYGRDNVFRNMVDVQFVAAMGPPGGGRTFISNRYTRHFNNLGLANVRGSGGRWMEWQQGVQIQTARSVVTLTLSIFEAP